MNTRITKVTRRGGLINLGLLLYLYLDYIYIYLFGLLDYYQQLLWCLVTCDETQSKVGSVLFQEELG